MYRAEVGLALTDEVFDSFTALQAAQSQGQDTSQAMAAMQQKFQQAEAALLETIAFVPAEYDNYVFLTNLYNVAGQMINRSYYEKAVAIADKGIKVEQFGPALRVQRARALQALNRTDDAIKDAEFAVKMDPVYSEARLLLAKLYESDGRPEDALKTLKAYPWWGKTKRRSTKRSRPSRPVRRPTSTPPRRSRALSGRTRRHQPAPQSARRIRPIHPSRAPAQPAASAARIGPRPALARRPRARPAARGGSRGRLRHPGPGHARPARLLAARDRDQDLDWSEWLANPSDPKTHLGLGYAYQSDGRYDKALEQYAIVLKSNPRDTAALYNQGNVYFKLGVDDRGEKSMWEVLKIDPTHALAAKALGEHYADKRRVQVAHRGRQARSRGTSRACGPAVSARHGEREARVTTQPPSRYYQLAVKYAPDMSEAQ